MRYSVYGGFFLGLEDMEWWRKYEVENLIGGAGRGCKLKWKIL